MRLIKGSLLFSFNESNECAFCVLPKIELAMRHGIRFWEKLRNICEETLYADTHQFGRATPRQPAKQLVI
jgi:hypothetical protein